MDAGRKRKRKWMLVGKRKREKGEGLEEERAWGLAHDAKRFCDGRFVPKCEMRLKKWRGGLGERGCQIFPDRTLADDTKRFYSDRWTFYW